MIYLDNYGDYDRGGYGPGYSDGSGYGRGGWDSCGDDYDYGYSAPSLTPEAPTK